ncbi:ABC transporter substrate-binding protein [Devosia nitrariae]|uniref:Sugar ABC transporter substrate-binding protein n=1 Tax=Devosia nitrariae TaxID=2071872 RepID=A0ABQ5W7P4_9HYPH|nr:extracellular solute-binding protein [Devosia nitrariae]GLQ55908.1 sugar ABC transporter substrate-binding protein [Devosia nitrariae]
MDSIIRRGLSRRSFLAGTAALGAATFLGTRRASAYDFNIPEPIGELKADGPFRWLDSGDQKAVFFRQFFEQYGRERGIETVYDGLPFTEIATVLPLGIRNNTAPDVFCLPLGAQPSSAVQEGWVRSYDDLIPDIESWKAKFPAGAFLEGLNMFDGKTYGLPYTSGRYCAATLLFNRKLMNDAGFDPESEPLTWDTFREAARKITEGSGGRTYGFIIGGAQVNRWNDVVRTLAQLAGASCGAGSIYAGIDFRTGEVVFDADQFVEAVELLIAMQSDGSIFPGSMSMNAPQARAFMPQGAAGMILQGPWNVPQWERENPDFDFGLAQPPTPQGVEQGYTTGEGVASQGVTVYINALSRNPEIAADVFHYLGTEQGQIDWANIDGVADAPVFRSAIENSQMSERSRAVVALFDKFVRVGPNPFVANAQLSEVAKAYSPPTPSLAETVQGLVTGQIQGVKESLTELVSATNTALDAAIETAKANGAEVSRDDFVFGNWDPSKDYTAEDYKAA